MNELLSATHIFHWIESGDNRWPELQQGLNHALQNGKVLFNALIVSKAQTKISPHSKQNVYSQVFHYFQIGLQAESPSNFT